jgi:hypothetical protein
MALFPWNRGHLANREDCPTEREKNAKELLRERLRNGDGTTGKYG